MIFSVSTVSDSVGNVEKFVRRNVAGGVDHLFIFLDTEQPEVEEFLSGVPSVTWVRTDRHWWRGDRPRFLNDRQGANAGVVTSLLAGLDGADWLFHIDGDEVVQLDRQLLAGLGKEHRVVKLATLEAAGQVQRDGEPIWWKPMLEREQLVLLKQLGVIEEATNRAYFRGHVRGKVGIRPRDDIQLSLHRALGADGAELRAYTSASLRLLHYESHSVEEYLRKWRALLAVQAGVRQTSDRAVVARSMSALLALGLTGEEAMPFLVRLYERTAADDLDTLRGLHLVEHVDPDEAPRTPENLPACGRAHLDRLLDRVREAPKRQFVPNREGRDLSATMAPLRQAAGIHGCAR